jgi:DNA-binding GntR family transcriptional regulator
VARNDSVSSGLLPIWREMLELGEALPSEEALAEALGTSRPAIREALIRMEADGLVRRHHGSGTFPNPAALDIPIRLDRAADFVDRLEAVGYRAEVEVLSAEVLLIAEHDALHVQRLGVDVGARVLRTVKRWRADGVVAAVAVDIVPLARSTNADAAIAAASDPVLELSTTFGLGRADWMCTWPSAVELDADLAEMLDYPAGRAVLRMEQVGVERLGRRVFHATEHHRPEVLEYGLIRTIG